MDALEPKDAVRAAALERVPGIDDGARVFCDHLEVERLVCRGDHDAVRRAQGACPEWLSTHRVSGMYDGWDVGVRVADLGALAGEDLHQIQGRRLAHVIDVGL